MLRDITAFKTAESELVAAKRAAEEASAQKSDLLAKISHEIRTPLSAIIGFAEVMIEERFGPIGNERYKDYLKDVHASGAHVISLVNDLLDLAKIEAGRMDLTFARVIAERARRRHGDAAAAAGGAGPHRHAHELRAAAAASRRRRALDPPDRPQPRLERDQVHGCRRPGDRLDGARRIAARSRSACATPASA